MKAHGSALTVHSSCTAHLSKRFFVSRRLPTRLSTYARLNEASFTLNFLLFIIYPSRKFRFFVMALSDYLSSKFLFIATANVFNVIALISAILLLLDPILFLAHTAYNFYQLKKAEKNPPPEKGRGKARGEVNPHRAPPNTAWWKWYVVVGIIHLLDAWFFRTFIPFLERARNGVETPGDDLRDLVDIARLLWGIVRALSILVLALEILEKRLVLKTVLGEDYKNPKWGFAIAVSLAPAIVIIAFSPVVVYWLLLALWNSTGFFWGVIVDAFKPDWRTGQDVFVTKIRETIVIKATETSKPALWQFWR